MSFLDGLFGPPNVEKLKDKGDVDGLIKALHYEKDYNVCICAAGALGKIGDKRAVEPLIAALEDNDRKVRWNAAAILGNIGDKRAVEPLIAALNDSNTIIMVSVIPRGDGVHDNDSHSDLESVITVLRDDRWYLRWNAAEALGKIYCNPV